MLYVCPEEKVTGESVLKMQFIIIKTMLKLSNFKRHIKNNLEAYLYDSADEEKCYFTLLRP